MRILLLDLGQVLLRFDPLIFCRKAADGSPHDAETVYRHLWLGRLKRELDTGRLGPSPFVDAALAWLDNPRLTRDDFVLAWQDVFWENDGTEAFLDRVAPDYALWMLSDTDPLHFQHLISRFPLVRRFSHYFLSYTTGCLKSDPAAFAPVLARCDPSRDEILFVDDVQGNVDVARQAGLPALTFTGWPAVAAALAGKRSGKRGD